MNLSRLLVLVPAFALAGCFVTLDQGRLMEADIVRLKTELEETKKELQRVEDRAEREREAALARVDAKVREVSDALDALNRAARKTGADLGVELEASQAEIARLRGTVEELQLAVRQLDQSRLQSVSELEARVGDTSARLSQLEEARKADEARRNEEAQKPRGQDKPADKEGFYNLAKATLDSGNFAGSRALFAEFIARWSSDPLAANAQYWIGESLYAEKRYRDAIWAFVEVTKKYAKSDKVPDALLKIGFAYHELKMPDDGRLYLEEVVSTYPKSPAAKLAREKLGPKKR